MYSFPAGLTLATNASRVLPVPPGSFCFARSVVGNREDAGLGVGVGDPTGVADGIGVGSVEFVQPVT